MPADLESNIGRIVDIVRHVADVAAALGDGLRAGQFIICGSLTPPMFLEPGERGVDFALAPIGAAFGALLGLRPVRTASRPPI